MDRIDEEIINILKSSPEGIKARTIAQRLEVERKTVNSRLYGKPKNQCYQDSNYLWYYKDNNSNDSSASSRITGIANKSAKTPHIQKEAKIPVPDVKLAKICNYYLNCLALEDAGSVKAFQTSKFTPTYVELHSLDDANDNPDAQKLIEQASHSRKNLSSYIGYPMMVRTRYSSKTGNKYREVIPVLVFSAEINGGFISRSALPSVNIEAVKTYTSNDSNDAIQELVKLEDELGLNNPEADIELDELIERLQSIRDWQWKDDLNVGNIGGSIPLPDISEDGIYNTAALLFMERSPYTEGLETELSKLAAIDESSYKESVLYKWIHPELIQHNLSAEDDLLLDVLPLNVEQEDAIHAAVNKDITVITGPPGTGKAQVVTDFIVNAAYQGKNVLFASKNNKAVDVVYARVNSLASKPAMIRIGGDQYAHTLAEMIAGMLSSVADSQDISDYDYYKKEYDKIFATYKTIKSEKRKVMQLRNAVDHYNQDTEIFRKKWSHQINSIQSGDQEQFHQLFEKYKSALINADKSKQAFFTRLFWFSTRKKREEELTASKKDLDNLLVSKYQQEPSGNTNSSETVEYLQNCEDALSAISNYKEALKKLDEAEPLEALDKRLFDLSGELAELAGKLWNKYLITRPIEVTAEERTEMTQYVSAMRLIGNDVNLSEYPELQKEFKKLAKKMTKFLPCWAVTSLSAKGRIPFQPAVFDYVVIDEASQCDIASALPLLYRARKAVIIGDPKQLTHVTSVNNKQDLSLLRRFDVDFNWSYVADSLYEHASSIVSPEEIVQLRDHHRSYADIIEFSNREFYNNKLRVATDYSKLRLPRNEKPGIRWIQANGSTQRLPEGSSYNDREIEAIITLLKELVYTDGYEGEIGIVTPFRAQANRINEALEKDSALYTKLVDRNKLVADTVHKFQGDEKDVMIFSPVIADGASKGAISFLQAQGNLFNVAVTRARAELIIVGNKEYCSKCEVSYLRDFVQYVNELEHKVKVSEAEYKEPTGREYPDVSNIDEVSDWEKTFYTALFDAGIRTKPQYPVDKYKLDLAIVMDSRKLDIEVDGERYHRDWNGELMYRDRLRNQRLYELGWNVKRFWVYQIRDEMPKCIQEIQNWILGNSLDAEKNNEEQEIHDSETDNLKQRSFKVAGTFYNLTGKDKDDLFDKILHDRRLNIKTIYKCRFVPEPDNQYDHNAIKVYIFDNGRWYFVGYVPKQMTSEILKLMNSNVQFEARATDDAKNLFGFEIIY